MEKTPKNRANRRFDLARAYLRSSYKAYTVKESFEDVETYCMFVGYPKSGHSLVGSLLDAHPNAVIGHELDALKYVQAGFSKRRIYQLLLENSRKHVESGREWNTYSYEVPGQWQGRFDKLRVIGDKKGGKSTVRLRSNPELLQRLRDTVGVGIKFVHVIRNPYDNISTMLRDKIGNGFTGARNRGLRFCIEKYFLRCATVRDLKEGTRDADVFDVRHESFVEDPARHLGGLCRFLGLEYSDGYLKDCASIIFESPSKSRHKVDWDPETIRIVQSRMDEFDFLRGYSYED
jgi:hypothetical protein